MREVEQLRADVVTARQDFTASEVAMTAYRNECAAAAEEYAARVKAIAIEHSHTIAWNEAAGRNVANAEARLRKEMLAEFERSGKHTIAPGCSVSVRTEFHVTNQPMLIAWAMGRREYDFIQLRRSVLDKQLRDWVNMGVSLEKKGLSKAVEVRTSLVTNISKSLEPETGMRYEREGV